MLNLPTYVSLSLTVNDVEHEVLANPSHTLLEVLRDDLGLLGAKRGCDDGTCGTCTVVVNGAMARACRVTLARAEGKEVFTVESLGDAENLHPLQQAFIDADAVQCGFCTPGMLMAAKALLGRNSSPTHEEVSRALGSNICRCTGYAGIVDAIVKVGSEANNGTSDPDSGPGQLQRADSTDKVLGIAKYAADLSMPGMLHAAVLRSPHAHADIVNIDVREAKALPGVVAVLTSEDVPGLNRFGRMIKDQPILADDRVRQLGDAVVAVAATSAEIAAEAVSLINIVYQPLPEILDAEAALESGSPAVHGDTNLLAERVHEWGDAEQDLSKSDVIIEETYTTPWCEHGYLEPEAALAYMDGDVLTVRSATQHSFLHQATIADTMGLPLEKVRILPTVIGGAFGGKTDVTCQGVVALLALNTGRPVKLLYTREESLTSTTKRHPFKIRCRTGATKDGKLTALHAEMIADTGAYASAGPGLYIRANVSLEGPYNWPSAYMHGKVVYTNNTLAGAMRGFGAPQVAFAVESQIDRMADELGIDRLSFREMNRRTTPAEDATPMDAQQEDAFEKTLAGVRPHYEAAMKVRNDSASNGGRYRRGVGIASMRYGVGASGRAQAPGRVSLELNTDGAIKLLTGAVDMGQGSDTALTIIAAEELNQPRTAVSIVTGDTSITPDAGPSTGSRLVYYVGNAAKDASVQMRDAVLATASDLLERPADDLTMTNGRVELTNANGGSDRSVSLAEIARARESEDQPLRFDGLFDPGPLIYNEETGEEKPYAVYVTATHMAEVEVDMERGNVQVLRIVAAHDVGRVVYPLGLKGQIEGAVSMGVGLALKEEYLPGVTMGFKQYRMPTTRDMPEVEMLMVETGDPSAGLGAKGVAECATVAVAPAIINAVADAVGARPYTLPATPARMMEVIGSLE